MNSTAELPAWRILPAPEGRFRWSSARTLAVERLKVMIPRGIAPGSPFLPSMPELLAEATSKLREGDDSDEGGVRMFQTASGRSVNVSPSSLQKAKMVLGEPDRSGGYGALSPKDSEEGGLPMFFTASEKLVEISKSSLEKAASVLKLDTPEQGRGDVGFRMLHTTSGTSCKDREDMFGSDLSVPMFQTGSGRHVDLKQSSIKRALAILHEEESVETGTMQKNHPNAGVGSFGKTINVTVGGVRRASELLDLDEKDISLFKGVTNQPSCCKENESPGMHSFTDGSAKGRQFSNCDNKNAWISQIESVGAGNLHVISMHASAPVSHQIKFQTAGGRSLPISDDAIRRARVLLGDSDSEMSPNGSSTSFSIPTVSNDRLHGRSHNKENLHFIENDSVRRRNMQEPSSLVSSHKADFADEDNVTKFAFGSERASKFDGKLLQYIPRRNLDEAFKDESLRIVLDTNPSRLPLADISNRESVNVPNQMHFSGTKRRQMKANSISPFKRPRSSRFSTPLRENISLLDTGQYHASSAKISCQKLSISTCYPSCRSRRTILEYFVGPPKLHVALEGLSDEIKHINPGKAAAYKFKKSPDCEGIGADDFRDLLVHAGASSLNATEGWVQNHYKWIVWKLACLERGYPEQARGKYLTPANVLEELKYRYDREVNHGHRSALKWILDGDASPSSTLVLCVSAVYPLSNSSNTSETRGQACELDADADKSSNCNIHVNSDIRKIELTDGWYSVNANLDAALSKHLASGKLFVGQKLRISGAFLLGWAGPVSSLEAGNSVSLQLMINGTYRAQWAERLGFCKGFRFPLAFRCIKGGGGQVPMTLVGVMRIYPILYKERLPDGGSIVRSEKMESNILHLRNQRRLLIAEDIMSKQDKLVDEYDDGGDEGAEILKILEASAEPEVLMADMSPQQLISISHYQAKREAIKQNAVVKKIETVLEETGLGSRDVTPFMRVRVVGLNPKDSSRKRSNPLQGLISIWNPTEQQRADLMEGRMYSVSGITPLNTGSDLLHLHARGSKSTWKLLPPLAIEQFEPFFNPRHAVLLLTLGELPLSREFDIAAVVLHVGEVFSAGHLKKQWIFLTDGSHGEHDYHLLAVSLCLPAVDSDPSAFLSPKLTNSIVCFYNLVKRGRDELNHLWVAEAMENSIWSQSGGGSTIQCLYSHLKESATRVKKWADGSPSDLQKLREKVLFIVGSACTR